MTHFISSSFFLSHVVNGDTLVRIPIIQRWQEIRTSNSVAHNFLFPTTSRSRVRRRIIRFKITIRIRFLVWRWPAAYAIASSALTPENLKINCSEIRNYFISKLDLEVALYIVRNPIIITILVFRIFYLAVTRLKDLGYQHIKISKSLI